MRPMPRWFVAVCWAMAILFSLSVGLQEHDPDPIRWMLLYGAAGLDLLLGLATLVWPHRPLWWCQIALMVFYSSLISWRAK